AWPGARYAVMGAAQAARTMLDVRVAALKRQGKTVDDAVMKALSDELRQRYDRETDIRYAAARGWVDEVIDPGETRDILIHWLGLVRRRPPQGDGRIATGVFQV